MTQCIKNSCYLRGRRGIVEAERGEDSLIVTWTFVMVNQLFVFLSLILLQYTKIDDLVELNSNCLCLAETSATQAVPLAGTRGTQRQEQAGALQQAAGGGHPLSHFAPPRHHIGHGGRRDRWTAPPGWDHPHRNNGLGPWLCLACPFSVPWVFVGCALVCLLVAPWLGSLSNPWPVAASISVSRRDTNAETSAIAQPPWSETASNQNAQLWGGFYLPSRAFNCGTICTAQLEMQVDSLVRYVKCICAYTFAYWISRYQKSPFASLLQLRSMKFNRPLALDGFGAKTCRISQKDQNSERTAEKVD